MGNPINIFILVDQGVEEKNISLKNDFLGHNRVNDINYISEKRR